MHVLKHSDGYCALVGGIVYRGQKFPELVGKYIYGEFCSGTIFAYDIAGESKKKNTALTRVRASILKGTDHGLSSFFESSNGDIYVLILGSMEEATGHILRLERSNEQYQTDFSATLPQEWDGMGTDSGEHIVAYELASPAFNNGAKPSYRIVLPKGANGGFNPVRINADGSFDFPAGTIFLKHLFFEEGASGTSFPVETQVILKRNDGGFAAASYAYDQTTRVSRLVEDAVSVQYARGDSGKSHEWNFVGGGICFGCHNSSTSDILGFNLRQLKVGQQVTELSRRGVFSPPISITLLENTPTLKDLGNPDASLQEKVRSYMDVNCAYCHRPNGLGGGKFDARIGTPLEAQNLINGDIVGAAFLVELVSDQDEGPQVLKDMKLIKPSEPGASLILRRMRDSTMRMPPFGLWSSDSEAIAVFEEWIRSLPED